MRVLVADDHEIVRAGVRQLLGEEFSDLEFGEAAEVETLLELARGQSWDVVLLDINMPGRNGLEALAALTRFQPQVPVLVLTMFSEQEYARRALKAGASGFISKRGLGKELIAAVKQVCAGEKYLTPSLAELLAKDMIQPGPALPHEQLSEREYAVMLRLAAGKSVKEIAAELALGGKTIFTYRARLLDKLGVRNDVEVARYALRHNLVQ